VCVCVCVCVCVSVCVYICIYIYIYMHIYIYTEREREINENALLSQVHRRAAASLPPTDPGGHDAALYIYI